MSEPPPIFLQRTTEGKRFGSERKTDKREVIKVSDPNLQPSLVADVRLRRFARARKANTSDNELFLRRVDGNTVSMKTMKEQSNTAL